MAGMDGSGGPSDAPPELSTQELIEQVRLFPLDPFRARSPATRAGGYVVLFFYMFVTVNCFGLYQSWIGVRSCYA